MKNHQRVVKVLTALLISMTLGAIVLLALGSNPPSAGPFCLASYYRLSPISDAAVSRAPQTADRWNRIEVCYSDTEAGNVEQLAVLSGHSNPEDLNCHFVICNGLGGSDGEIQSTEKWQRQFSLVPTRTWYGSSQTLRICVVANGTSTRATDAQLCRTEELVEHLQRRFKIEPASIYYPGNWQ